jgi:hypothetical protein
VHCCTNAPTPFCAYETTLFAGKAIVVRRQARISSKIETYRPLSQLVQREKSDRQSLSVRDFTSHCRQHSSPMAPSSRKILIVGRPKSGKLSLVKALTSSLPNGLTHETTTPHAGLSHTITLTTRYYSTDAGIWIDEIPEDTETWLDEYLSDEATPVLHSLAVVIFTVDPASSTGSASSTGRQELSMIKKLNERGEDIEWDGTCIIVGKQSQEQPISDITSFCDDNAIEYIDLNQSGQNDYGGTASPLDLCQ